MIPSDDQRLALCDDVAIQSLGQGQDTVVLSLSSGYLYTCSPTTAAFLKALDGQRTVAQVLDILLKQYDVPAARLRQDVMNVADTLIDEKLIRIMQ